MRRHTWEGPIKTQVALRDYFSNVSDCRRIPVPVIVLLLVLARRVPLRYEPTARTKSASMPYAVA
jgi:hypothetical protein